MKIHHTIALAVLPFLGACGTMIKLGEMAMEFYDFTRCYYSKPG